MNEMDDEVDLFDEFKIKPINEGLGFHNKESKLKSKEEGHRGKPSFASKANSHFKGSLEGSPKRSNKDNTHHHKSKEGENSKPLTSLDRQFMEMNALIEKLNTSFVKDKSKKNEDEEEKPLALNWNEEDKSDTQPSLSSSSSSDKPMTTSSFFDEIHSYRRENESVSKKSDSKESGLKENQGSIEFPSPDSTSISSFHDSTPSESSDNSVSLPSNEVPISAKSLQPSKSSKPESIVSRQKDFTQKQKSSNSENEWISASFPHFGVLIIDGFFNVGLTTIFMTVLLTIVKVDFFSMLVEMRKEAIFFLCLLMLYVSNLFIYLIVSRSFFGKTLGEWTFNYRLGRPSIRENAFYPFLVMWRVTLVFITGVFLFPLMSLLFRRDIASYFTGLCLQKKKPKF